MGLSLEDVRRWDYDDLLVVGAAADLRAVADWVAAKDLEKLPAIGSSQGAAARAAEAAIAADCSGLREEAARTQDVTRGISACLGEGATRLEDIKRQIPMIVREAALPPVIEVDLGASSVIGPVTTGMSETEVAEVNDKIGRLREWIRATLAAADLLDQELAGALRAAVEASRRQ